MGERGVKVLQNILEFKRLDKKKGSRRLTAKEEVRWRELHDALGAALYGRSAPPSGVSQRQSMRVPCEPGDPALVVRFRNVAEFHRAYIKDISNGGLYIASDLLFELDAEIEIQIDIGEPTTTLRELVRVVWVNPKRSRTGGTPAGMGVRFLGSSPATRRVIDGLVHQTLDSAAAKQGGKLPKKSE